MLGIKKLFFSNCMLFSSFTIVGFVFIIYPPSRRVKLISLEPRYVAASLYNTALRMFKPTIYIPSNITILIFWNGSFLFICIFIFSIFSIFITYRNLYYKYLKALAYLPLLWSICGVTDIEYNLHTPHLYMGTAFRYQFV